MPTTCGEHLESELMTCPSSVVQHAEGHEIDRCDVFPHAYATVRERG